MKKKIIIFLFLIISNLIYAKVFVKSYRRKDGTYVKAHFRSSPSSSGKKYKKTSNSYYSNYSTENVTNRGYKEKIFYDNLTENTIVNKNDIFIEIPVESMEQIKFYIVDNNETRSENSLNLFLKEEKPTFLTIKSKNYIIIKR
ncbi:MAG: hypothetical protein SOY60_06825 [Fusobacterium gastrosuis]|uniref:hypothetical protein n=1 Tax=Fusobacterium gastrosuis TaxID=1755100 RepID=UPI002A8476AB|nr:hypothetical protein [Fusobacterium gastrosuis]